MKIHFLHGWHSVPGGVKPTFLTQHGHEVVNPQLPDDDFILAEALASGPMTAPPPAQVLEMATGAVARIDQAPGVRLRGCVREQAT